MDDPLPTYVYEPLPPQHIRILHLSITSDSANEAGSLSCSLETIAFSNDNEEAHTPFEALSYTWGSQAETYPLICDGKELRIHHNLHEALPCLARRSSTLPLWIDAVCINQLDEKEKIQQIRLMATVFSGAECVWAWLGFGDEAATYQAVHEIIPNLEAANEAVKDWTLVRTLSTQDFNMPETTSPAWDAFFNIVYSPWFTRLWVLQEACLARELKFLYGNHQLELYLLRKITQSSSLLNHLAMLLKRDLDRSQRCAEVLRARDTYQHIHDCRIQAGSISSAEHLEGIAHMIVLSVGSECSDPKDCVRGILGLLEREAVEQIHFDVDTSVVDLYAQLTRFMVRCALLNWYPLGRVLCFAIKSRSEHSLLPSWCPDFHACTNIFAKTDRWSLTFQASSRECTARIEQSLREMHLRGVIVDDIRRIGPAHLTPSSFNFSSFGEWELQVRSLFFLKERQTRNAKPEISAVDLHDYILALVAEAAWLRFCTPTLIEAVAKLFAFHSDFPDFLNAISVTASEDEPTIFVGDSMISVWDAIAVLIEISSAQDGFTTFSTTDKHFGFSNGHIETGDQVVIFDGAKHPHLIRRCPGDREVYQLIGEVYLRGMMRGEVEDLGFESREIVLV